MTDAVVDSQVPPHDLAAEAAVLSALILTPDALTDVADTLHREHFYSERHGRIYEAIVELGRDGHPIDVVQVATRLRETDRLGQVGGMAYILEMQNSAPAVANIRAYAKSVYDTWRVRQMQRVARETVARGYCGYDDAQRFADETATSFHELAFAGHASAELVPVCEPLREAIEELYHAKSDGRDLVGLSTSLPALDRVLGGLRPGSLTILAARPGKGKSALALQMAIHAAKGDDAVAFFSLEMPKRELAMRAVCAEGRIDYANARIGMLTPADWSKMTSATEAVAKLPLFIDDSAGLTVMAMRSKLRRANADRARAGKKPVKLVAVDYLQLARGTPVAVKQGREREVAEIAQDTKEMAKEFDVPVVALSQMNREVEKANRRPRLSDLRESGNIEQAADNILFIHEPEKAQGGRVELVIEKQRSGPKDIVSAIFVERFTRFESDGIDESRGYPEDSRYGD